MSINSVVNDLVTSVSVINALKPLPPTISGYSVAGKDDTALDPAGGQTVQINGTGFLPGATITFDGSAVAVVTYVNPNQLTFTSPAKSAGTYTIYVVNSDGGTAIYIPGIIYSVLPTWTTAAGSLGSYYETTSISNTVVASGDAPITYSLFSGSLPTGSTLYANGVITGTAPVDSSSTTYSFTIQATDAQLQDSTRSFSLTINVDAVTWVSPANNTTYTSAVDSAIANVALSATDAAGYAVSYSANALPTGLTLTGSNIAGTPTVIADSSTLLTATAATTNRTAVRTINWSITVANDIYFEYNTLLIPGASTTFVDDASTNNFAVSIFGDTKPNSFNPYTPGYYSNYFDGTGDYLTIAGTSTACALPGDFTIECWYYQLATTNYGSLFSTTTTYSTANSLRISTGPTNNTIQVASAGSAIFNASTTFTPSTWVHFALVRSGSTVTLYQNGVSVGSATNSQSFVSDTFIIGDVQGAGAPYCLNGYMSNFRVVKGTAVYTAAFTPSTTPLTAIANTSLLTCQSNRFIDNSTNNFTLTVAGNTSISSFDPFVPNSSYSTYGSGYFDGNGDYLSMSSSSSPVASQDFTIECWYYPVTRATIYGTIYGNFLTYSASGIAIWDRHDSWPTKINVQCGGVNATSTTSVVNNTWYHIAVTRASGTLKLYINGVLEATTAGANSSNTPDASFIGRGDTTSLAFTYINAYVSDFRIVKGTAVYTTAFTPPSAPLTAIANTSLLTLQNNQSVNNNVFLDNSTNNFFVTRYGNTTQGTFSPYGGNWSNYFDGTGDYLNTPTNAAFTFGTGDLTLECWIYQTATSTSTYRVIFADNVYGSAGGYTLYSYNNALNLWKGGAGGEIIAPAGTITLNTWNHVAWTRSGSSNRLFINGAQVGATTTDSTNYTGTASYIGSSVAGTFPFAGYISNARIVKGTAVYTTTFTPSTTPLTAISGTSLLTCADNRFIDDSINNFTITKTGDVSVQRFSPFNPSIVTPTSYSGYFDGTGDYLTVPDNTALQFSTGAFTMELWFYPTATISSQILLAKGTGGDGFELRSRSSGGGNYFSFWTANGGTAIVESNVTFTLNTWQHLAVVRSSGTMTLYKNGVNVGSASDSTSFVASGSALRVAVDVTAGNLYSTGYISNVRIVKGVAVYTGAFTVPTSPLAATQSSGTNIAAITGTATSLLTCQSTTFIDNSTNNFTITAFGNSQPRQQNPFGVTSVLTSGYTVSTIGGSGYFDNAGDYLTVPSTVQLEPGSGNFTIEAWVYPLSYPSAGTGDAIITRLNSSGYNNFSVNMRNNGNIEAYFSLSNTASPPDNINAGSVLLNAWTHIAFVKNGLGRILYLNGVSVGTVTSASNPPTGLSTVTNIGTADSDFNGYISGLRVTKSIVYSSGFVPPATPSTAITNTSLLLNYTGAGIYDAAMMNNMETVGDSKLSTAISKFGGSSMSFDGTGDYAVQPTNINFGYGTGDFTIEFWLYMNSVSADQTIFSNLTSGTSVNPHIYYLNGTAIIYYTNGANRITGSALNTSTWYHIAVCRGSGSTRMFINGTQTGSTYADSNNYGTTAPLGIATYWLSGSPVTVSTLNGYIDDLRITKGYARYTSNFTAPTSAFPIY